MERLLELEEFTIDTISITDSTSYENKEEAYIVYHL